VSGSPASEGAAAGWRLRPGVHVVRRDDQHLQVGLDRRRAVVLPDRPTVRVALEALREHPPAAGPGPDGSWVVHRLVRADLLVDRAVLVADRRTHGVTRADAAHARHGPDASRRLAARAAARVDLVVAGLPGGRPVDPAGDLVAGLADQGVVVHHAPAGSDPAHEDRGQVGAVVVVLSLTTVRRTVVDPLVRRGLPHLVVAGEDGGVRVGPFVEPGSTACLRCVDAHVAEGDPRWALVRDQVAAGDVHPAPYPPDWQQATGLAVADVLRWVDGDRPVTWSSTIHLGPEPEPAPAYRTRHPHCGCTWDEL